MPIGLCQTLLLGRRLIKSNCFIWPEFEDVLIVSTVYCEFPPLMSAYPIITHCLSRDRIWNKRRMSDTLYSMTDDIGRAKGPRRRGEWSTGLVAGQTDGRTNRQTDGRIQWRVMHGGPPTSHAWRHQHNPPIWAQPDAAATVYCATLCLWMPRR